MPVQTKNPLKNSFCGTNLKYAATKRTQETKISKKSIVASAVLHTLFGFVLGCAKMPYGVYPCGTALIFSAGSDCFFAYLGASLACVTYPYGIGSAFAINTIAFFARTFFSSYRFDEKKHKRLAFSLCLAFLCAVTTCFVGGIEEKYLLPALSYFVALPCLVFAFCTFTENVSGKTMSVDGSFCAVCFIAAFSLSFLELSFFSPALFFCTVATLLCASGGGSIYGLLIGLVCAVGCGSTVLAFILGISGFAAGCCDNRQRGVCSFCFFALFCSLSFVLGQGNILPHISGVAAGCLFYLPAANVMPKVFEGKRTLPQLTNSFRDYEKLSHAFSSISDMVYTVSDKLKYPTRTEVIDEIRKISDSHCALCSMSTNCYSRKLYDSLCVEDVVCERLLSGGVKKSDLPEKYASGCIKLSDMVEKLNDSYARMVFDRFRDNKTEILASEYASMARLIKYTSQKEKTDTTTDPLLEDKATKALAAIGVRFSSVKAYGKRNKTIEVSGVLIDKFPCSSKELSDYMSEKCGYLFSEPDFVGVGENTVMRLKRARKIKLEYSRCACAKGGNGVNGDSVSFFESDDDFFYALISDGMGSGRSAALTSRLTALFLEKLLTTGTHKNVTLEMLNNLLLSKNDESFATVDLLEVDLLSGDASFIKAGAAPAYIVRASKLYKIASFTPPAGIVRSFCAESTKFSLEKGDTVLMLSDGVVQSSDDAPWLCEMLSAEIKEDPSLLCDRILSKARKINIREDDMSCAAVRVV